MSEPEWTDGRDARGGAFQGASSLLVTALTQLSEPEWTGWMDGIEAPQEVLSQDLLGLLLDNHQES